VAESVEDGRWSRIVNVDEITLDDAVAIARRTASWWLSFGSDNACGAIVGWSIWTILTTRTRGTRGPRHHAAEAARPHYDVAVACARLAQRGPPVRYPFIEIHQILALAVPLPWKDGGAGLERRLDRLANGTA
jgi:hypothetical protein